MGSALVALRPALREIMLRLTLDAPEAQIDALLAYLSLLQRWNATYNLTALREPAQMLTQHVADCLAVMTPGRSPGTTWRTFPGRPNRTSCRRTA